MFVTEKCEVLTEKKTHIGEEEELRLVRFL